MESVMRRLRSHYTATYVCAVLLVVGHDLFHIALVDKCKCLGALVALDRPLGVEPAPTNEVTQAVVNDLGATYLGTFWCMLFLRLTTFFAVCLS